MIFKCKVCAEKEKLIAELKSQITDLRSMVFSPTRANSLSLVAMEADAVLSGKSEAIALDAKSLSEEQRQQLAEIESEAQLILSGNY